MSIVYSYCRLHTEMLEQRLYSHSRFFIFGNIRDVDGAPFKG